ncbi:MAG: DUF2292 domain-containing protein [Treponema sp.]|jgi:hypothetical protein|nr:DUF2292 domain-containing protein [Treponema sp.]
MNYEKTKAMILKLIAIADNLKYGTASIIIKKHDGRIVQVSYTTEEHIREKTTENKQEN